MCMRIPRFEIIFEGCKVHCFWKCHDDEYRLRERAFKELYYRLLLKYKDRYSVRITGYCLMDNHVHLTLMIKDPVEFSRFLQVVNSVFARKANMLQARRHNLIADRPKTKVIADTARDELEALCYLDANPFDTTRPVHPQDWEFSSYHYYAEGKSDPLITPSEAWLELGETDRERQEAYREMVEQKLLAEMKASMDRLEGPGCYFGNPDWVIEEGKKLRKRLAQRKAAQPKTRTWPAPWNRGLKNS